MEKNKNSERDYYTVDVIHVLRVLWYRAWIIVLAAILAAAAGFSISAFVISPKYSSSILLYVNNNSLNLGSVGVSISASDISASQSLVKTYTEILKNRTTLERIVETSGVNYTYSQLNGMITAGSSNGTEIMRVTVVATDPNEAAKIANCIAEILPSRINEIIDGATMEVVDSAIPRAQKVSPSISKYTALAMMLGAFVSAAFIAIAAMMDDTIHDETYVIETYDYPILAKIPNLVETSTKEYAYNYQNKKTNVKR